MEFGSKKLYIGGQLTESSNGETYDVICPGNEQAIASISWASKEDTATALDAAQEGFEYWSQLSIDQRNIWISKLRNKLLEKSELLRTAVMYEMGKVWAGTEEDMTSITNALQFYSEEIKNRSDINIPDKEGTHQHKIVHQPIGVVVAFLAYNFPLLNLGFKLGPALAAGCSIIIKPSEYSPLSAYIIGELCDEINFPKGVINILCGDVQNVGIPLCESKIPRLITMIGSTETAQKLIVQSSKTSIKQFSMECGGNAPFIVFPDADMELAINIGSALKIGNTGQICVAPNRFYVHKSVIDDFVSGMKGKFDNAKVGFGRANNPDMGPLTNQQSVDKVDGIVKEAIQQGGQVITGGNTIDQPGYYYEPTLIQSENNEIEILQKESFGPIAIVVPFSSKEEVIELANNTNAGLASYVFSKDQETLDFFVQHLAFGEIQLNGVKYDIYLPHGGIKDSGIGMDCSTYALDDYLVKKRVSQSIT